MPTKTIVLKDFESINPGEIETYLAKDGFAALRKARSTMKPEEVTQEVTRSGLLGRGGAGYSCGLKWELARKTRAEEKYFICNADEGEVGTFKDRFILQRNPFALIEAIGIACYAIGVQKAYIYLRAEYRYLLHLLLDAIEQVKQWQFLEGMEIEVRLGAGAYVCGEETALMNSIEGKRGESRYKPPFPPQQGLWGKPTIINNVETLMNIPQIILNGSQWFGSVGTDQSKGTKVFSVSGDVAKPGVYELQLGSELAELVVDLAQARNPKMIQIGGAAGRIIPSWMMDVPLSFETILGAGAVTVYDENRDVLDIANQTVKFFANESCGKCTPCREGSEVMVEILDRLSKGEGADGDIEALEEVSYAMSLASLCGLGQAAPTAIADTLQHFRKDYEMKVKQAVFLRGLRV